MADSSKHTLQRFEATHGALGGVPWPDIRGDAAASELVKEWMWGWFRKEGVNLFE